MTTDKSLCLLKLHYIDVSRGTLISHPDLSRGTRDHRMWSLVTGSNYWFVMRCNETWLHMSIYIAAAMYSNQTKMNKIDFYK